MLARFALVASGPWPCGTTSWTVSTLRSTSTICNIFSTRYAEACVCVHLGGLIPSNGKHRDTTLGYMTSALGFDTRHSDEFPALPAQRLNARNLLDKETRKVESHRVTAKHDAAVCEHAPQKGKRSRKGRLLQHVAWSEKRLM